MDERFWKRTLLNDKLASWILGACVFALVFALIVLLFHSYMHHVDVKRVEFSFVPVDSALMAQSRINGDSLLISKASIDSIMSHIEAHELQLSQKYQYALEKREEDENYRNIFMLIFGVAVSTVGFFGYRSFTDIDHRAMKIAEEKANEVAKTESPEVAKTEAQSTAQKYCDDNVNELVQQYLNNNLQSELNKSVNQFYNGEGKNAIIAEVTRNVDQRISEILKSETGMGVIDIQIDEVLKSDQMMELLARRLMDLKKETESNPQPVQEEATSSTTISSEEAFSSEVAGTEVKNDVDEDPGLTF